MILSSILLAAAIVPARILFLGNSHTANCNVPSMVKSIIESDSKGRKIETEMITGGLLDDLSMRDDVVKSVKSGEWDVIVLQGAKMSSSHKYSYSQENAISLAKLAKQSGSRVLLFAEWPRRGWQETEFILNIYNQISKASGSEVVPTCRAWDEALAKDARLGMWLPDGNHSSLQGAYLAALTIATFIVSDPRWLPNWRPTEVSSGTATMFRAVAMKVWKNSQGTHQLKK